MKIQKIMTVLGCAAIACAAGSSWASMQLSEARQSVAAAIESTETMASTIKQLSPADQRTFLADVNAAIAKLGCSAEEKAAKALNANRAALDSVAQADRLAMVAETFATAPVETLALINEDWGKNVFNRSNGKPVSDAKFYEIASNAVAAVANRTAGSDEANIRNAFAILAMVRASNGTPADLAASLSSWAISANDRELANSEWYPAALAQGDDKSYEPMLGSIGANKAPNTKVALNIAGIQTVMAFCDGFLENVHGNGYKGGDLFTDRIGDDDGLSRIPRPYMWQTL